MTTISEDFTAQSPPDEDIGNTLSWTEFGDWDIISGSGPVACAQNADNPASVRADSDLTGTDHYAEIVLNNPNGSSQFIGPAVRFSSSAETCYVGFARDWPTASYRIAKIVAGTFTALGTDVDDAAVDLQPGDRVRLSASGTTLTLYVNDVQVHQVADASISTGTRCGMHGRNGTSQEVRSFEAGDLGGSGSSVGLIGFAGNRLIG